MRSTMSEASTNFALERALQVVAEREDIAARPRRPMVAAEYLSNACSASCASYSRYMAGGVEASHKARRTRLTDPRRSELAHHPHRPCAITVMRSSLGKTTVTG